MSGAESTVVSNALLAKILSQLEVMINSQRALEEKVDALADTLRAAAKSAPSQAYSSSAAVNSSYIVPQPAMLPPASTDFGVSSVLQHEIEQMSRIQDEQTALYLQQMYFDSTDIPEDHVQRGTHQALTLGTEHENPSLHPAIARLYDLHPGPNPASASADNQFETRPQGVPATPTRTELMEAACTSRSLSTSNTASMFGQTDSPYEFFPEHQLESNSKPTLTQAQAREKGSFTGTTWKNPSLQESEQPSNDAQMVMIEDFTPLRDVSQPVRSRFTSSQKAPPSRPRIRTTSRHQNHQYLDSLLRSKCPEDRLHALNLAIQFRDGHNLGEVIPSELLDELLEAAGDEKYFCFCCPRDKKARTITPARDHVRKSLGNFPFKCSNSWCRHSSLRQADLNKHLKTCNSPI